MRKAEEEERQRKEEEARLEKERKEAEEATERKKRQEEWVGGVRIQNYVWFSVTGLTYFFRLVRSQ